MSRLYATIDSDSRKTRATSRGHKHIVTNAAGWNGSIEVTLYTDGDEDRYEVRLVPWKGSGGERWQLASGVLNASVPQ